jgi:flagellar hook-length control protein FliK
MTIRLRPDELGSVMVKVITGEAGTTVALMAESRSAANHLQQQRHLLLNELEESGLRGTTIDIGMGNGSAQDQPRDETGPGTTRTGLGSSAMTAEARPSRDRTAQRTRTTTSGTVDLAL